MPDRTDIAVDLQVIVPNLHWRYTGVTATSRMVSPLLAKRFRAAWLGTDPPEGIARMGFGDLLRLWRRPAPLIWHARRNNEMIAGPAAARARLAAEAGVHLGGATPSHRVDALADPADGRDHRDLVDLGLISEARVGRGDAWRRYRGLCAAGRSRGGVRGERTAGTLRHRMLRSRARAKGERCLRRGDASPVAALSRFHGRDGRRHHAGPDDVCERSEEADRGRRACLAHRHHR